MIESGIGHEIDMDLMYSPGIEIVGAYLLDDLLQGPFIFHVQLRDQRLLLLPYLGGDGGLHY